MVNSRFTVFFVPRLINQYKGTNAINPSNYVVKYETELSIMATTTCQNHTVKFTATERHLLFELYGYFKRLNHKKRAND